MKTSIQFLAILLLTLFSIQSADAQSRRHKKEEAKKPNVFEATFDKSFPTVWKVIQNAITESGCLIEHAKFRETDEGTYKGKLTSTFCVIAAGEDTTIKVLERYSERVPYIRAGLWTSARMHYTFYVTENDDGTVLVKMKGEISGYEEYVTNKFHYFDSNGQLETTMLTLVKTMVAKAEDEDF